MLKCRSSSNTMNLSQIPRSSWHQSHSPGRFSSSEYDISYVHNSNIKLVQFNICTTKIKLDHHYSSWVDYRSVESSFLNSYLTYMVVTPSLILRPSVMVATPPFPSALQISSTRKRRRSDPHDNSWDSSSSHIYIWWNSPSLIPL